MWLLEGGQTFDGRRLWLRPGKTYLFGRTAAEAGHIAISDSSISRKHMTITVEEPEPERAQQLSSRSNLTVEDLGTKHGTLVNQQKIKGEKLSIDGDEAELKLGKCKDSFRLVWLSIVFTFSFTVKELRSQPLAALRDQFRHLDIKLLTEYDPRWTSHVIVRKRNTAKGLQALIHGRYIVTETFLDAINRAAESDAEDAVEPSALEMDFDQNWPDPMQYLPPRGGEPVVHPDDLYAPDGGRRNIFEGYTFIFYESSQFKNLRDMISEGGGKALLQQVTAGETQVDDFLRYVKGEAGEKGLGSFEDGSEGKGVVVVRYLPTKGDEMNWYMEFFTAVSLRLDHRPIEQNEFLEAILIKDASILRRPLEVDSSSVPAAAQEEEDVQDVIEPFSTADAATRHDDSGPPAVSQPAPRRGAARRPIRRRFAGFAGSDDDEDMEDAAPPPASGPAVVHNGRAEEDSMFVPHETNPPEELAASHDTRPSQRKRPASVVAEDNLLEGMAPAAARFKRQRMESGQTFASPSPERAPETESGTVQKRTKKTKKELDVLAVAAQNREQEEARARAEKEDLANLPDDVDLAEIRRLNIVEEMEIRQPSAAARSREQDVVDGRWNPKWNGMKNFKKFRQRGEAQGRQPARVIVPLTEVKVKEFGVGDDYWLEDEAGGSRKKKPTQQSSFDTLETPAVAPPPPQAPRRVIVSDSSDEDGEEGDGMANTGPAASTRRRGAATSQAGIRTLSPRTTGQSQGKRSGQLSAAEPPAKRTRQARTAVEVGDSDDSDDDLKFRFGKRR